MENGLISFKIIVQAHSLKLSAWKSKKILKEISKNFIWDFEIFWRVYLKKKSKKFFFIYIIYKIAEISIEHFQLQLHKVYEWNKN